MTELSKFWDGTTVGDAATEAPYDAPTEFAEYVRSVAEAAALAEDLGGVFRDDLNRLAVSGVATPVTVATGRALVHGTWYENDIALTVAVPTPAALTRIDRIVLRKDWVAQTVRVARLAGVEGGGAPALTRNAGTTWESSLAQISVDIAGVITVTDERRFIGSSFTLRKTLAQTINNEGVLANNPDDDLYFWLGANESVEFEVCLFFTSWNSAADVTHDFTVPAGAAGLRGTRLYGSGTLQDADPGLDLATAQVSLSASGANHILIVKGTVANGATPGRVQLRWAQNVATVADLTAAIGSYMRITRV